MLKEKNESNLHIQPCSRMCLLKSTYKGEIKAIYQEASSCYVWVMTKQ